MSASWICTLDMFPAKLTAVTRQKVIHTATYRKELEICNTPIARQAEQVIGAVTQSYFDNPSKLADNHIELF